MNEVVKSIMIDELKRLNRQNDRLEQFIIKEKIVERPEHNLINNILAMCEIAKLSLE